MSRVQSPHPLARAIGRRSLPRRAEHQRWSTESSPTRNGIARTRSAASFRKRIRGIHIVVPRLTVQSSLYLDEAGDLARSFGVGRATCRSLRYSPHSGRNQLSTFGSARAAERLPQLGRCFIARRSIVCILFGSYLCLSSIRCTDERSRLGTSRFILALSEAP